MGAMFKAAVAAGVILAVTQSHSVTASLDSASGANGANVALGQRLAARDYGWTGNQWNCLYSLWQGESGWSSTADTRATGLDPASATVFAYGISQARPATKLPLAAQPADLGGSSDARDQIKWGLGYVERTYGTPCAALSFKQSHGNQGY